jgi:hypothetical protein
MGRALWFPGHLTVPRRGADRRDTVHTIHAPSRLESSVTARSGRSALLRRLTRVVARGTGRGRSSKENPVTQQMRNAERHRVACPVEIHRSMHSAMQGFATDLSPRGAFVMVLTPDLPAVGANVVLTLMLNADIVLEAHAVVRWQRDAKDHSELPGVGVEFMSMADGMRQRLERWSQTSLGA